MGYIINEQLSDSEWTAAINALATFGTPRRIESITIHHWGSFGQTHYGVVDFFVNRNANTSAHFVASDSLIHCLVSPANVAWAAGNAYGNATSIHIEARPEGSDGDYRTVSWLVAWIRSVYGHNLPLKAHREWSATACPGKWDLGRVDREARAWTAKEFTKTAPAAAKPAPVQPAPKPAPAAPRALATPVNRTVTVHGSKVRTGPGTNYALAPGYPDGLAAGAVIGVIGYVKGQAVTPANDAWYKTRSGFYIWANLAGDNIAGLPYLNP